MAKISGIHHIAMKAVNEEEFNKTVNFYKNILGLEVVRTWPTGIMLNTGAGLLEIFNNGEEKLDLGVIQHIAFNVDDVDAFVKKVTDAGYEIFKGPKDIVIQSTPEFPARMAFCHGPLGEEIEFFHER